MDFLIGGIAGSGATIVTNPIDVIKTRLQLQGELKARTDLSFRYKGTFHALYLIAKTDGVFALQRGLGPAMLLGFTMNSVRLGMYHVAEVQGWTKTNDGDINVHKTMFWSSVSGVMSGLAANPASVLKTRMQAAAHPSIAVGRQHLYDGMIDGFTKIYKTEGVRGFFAGINATCTRLALGSAVQLTTYSTAKETLLNQGIFEQSAMSLAFAASCISGIALAMAICPIDVVAVRLYNQGPAIKSDRLYAGVLDCLRKIYKTEGLHGLYKGLGPFYLRLAPHTTLSLVIWDMLNIVFDNKIH